MSNLRPQDIIERFEIPEEYHHAIWEAYSAGAHYGFFKAFGKDLYAERVIKDLKSQANTKLRSRKLAPKPTKVKPGDK